MRIDELDEFQGLTPQMVREWLGRHGWVTVCWVPDDFNVDTVGGRERIRFMSDALITIAQKENRSIQSLLREINPRMRGPGYPSDAAARAHGNGGWWVFQHQQGADDPRSVTKPGELHTAQMCLSSAFNDVRFYWERGLMGEPCDEACMWWPCDEHGNKVRWPTDAEGKML